MKKSYNKILMSILAVFMPIMSYAHDVEIGEIFYNLDNNSKEATVTYKGSNPDNEDYTRFVVIPSTITHNGTKYSVTGIGACAFNNCINGIFKLFIIDYQLDSCFWNQVNAVI